MTLAPGWSTIPVKIRRALNIEHGQSLSILDVKSLKPHSRLSFHIENDQVDLLSLIPEQTKRGYPLYVDHTAEAEDSWLSIWYYHERGAARQIELKRYVGAKSLGALLGQLQAEGVKKENMVAFKNRLVEEHADFVSGLLELGVRIEDIHARCVFNPERITSEVVREYAEDYSRATGVSVSSFNKTATMKGSVAADTFVRSSVLGTVLGSIMNGVRRGIYDHEELRRAFIAKVLTGDGSLDVRKTPKRLDVRVKILDQVHAYLQDYAYLLDKEGFKPRTRLETITVRSYCTWLNLLKLYEIGAFRNSRSWNKLLCAIAFEIKGRENSGYARVRDLSQLYNFTSHDICQRYKIGTRAANLWLHRARKLGLIKTTANANKDRFIRYASTEEGRNVVKLLNSAEREFNLLCDEMGTTEPERLLELLKTKSKKPRMTNRSSK